MVVNPLLCLQALNIFHTLQHLGYTDIWTTASPLRDIFDKWSIQNPNINNLQNTSNNINSPNDYDDCISFLENSPTDYETDAALYDSYLEPTEEAMADTQCFQPKHTISISQSSNISPHDSYEEPSADAAL